MKATIELAFQITETVFLKSDKLQAEGIVTGFLVRKAGIEYEVAFGTQKTWHWAFELIAKPDSVQKVGFEYQVES